MQNHTIAPALFEGTVAVEEGDGWMRPWRLPCDRLDLFIAPGDSLVGRARESSGVRLRFATDSTTVCVSFLPLAGGPVNPHFTLDLTIDGELIAGQPAAVGAESVTFAGLPAGSKTVEIWCPHDGPIEITGLSVDDGATVERVQDPRPKWVTYGSSLTHCRRAFSPARTWPAIVARRRQFNLTSLGFGGNCCLDPMVALTIRDMPADFISLKLGINCIGGALSPRTFPGAVLGLVQIIREKHHTTPIALISPIGYPPNETKPNMVGNTIEQMRTDIKEVHSRLTAHGDADLYYFDGLQIFNLDEIAEYTQDQCHPNGEGIELMAEHFLDRIMPSIPV